jgi:hypothetical protein
VARAAQVLVVDPAPIKAERDSRDEPAEDTAGPDDAGDDAPDEPGAGQPTTDES